ncbi:histidine phosphatase family protein [Bacteroidota bacterium]
MSEKYIELYLGRHGQTFANLLGILQGWTHGRLTMRGLAETAELGFQMKDKEIEYVLCGNLGRQIQSTYQANQWLMLDYNNIELTELLRERHLGNCEGKLSKDYGLAFQDNFKGNELYSKNSTSLIKNPETLVEVTKRVDKLIEKIYSLGKSRIMTMGSGWINSYIINRLFGEEFIEHPQENASAHYFLLNQHGEVEFYRLEKIKVNLKE